MAAKGKKNKKVVTDGVAHIHSSFNNTIVTIIDNDVNHNNMLHQWSAKTLQLSLIHI